MTKRKFTRRGVIGTAGVAAAGAVALSVVAFPTQSPAAEPSPTPPPEKKKKVGPLERKEAAKRFREQRSQLGATAKAGAQAVGSLTPGSAAAAHWARDAEGHWVPHYFGPYPNWAYTKMPTGTINAVDPVPVNAGSGYSVGAANVESIYGTHTTVATVNITAVEAAGAITGITLATGGAGYTTGVATINQGGNTSALVNVTLDPATLTGGVRKFVEPLIGLFIPDNTDTFANPKRGIPVAVPDTTTYGPGGAGYTSTPTIRIEDPSGTGATAHPVMSSPDANGKMTVASVVVDNPGTGYSAYPTIIFEGGGATTQAMAIAEVAQPAGTITAINLTGCDYYEIELGKFFHKFHADLYPLSGPGSEGTQCLGYRQTNGPNGVNQPFHYLGPLIVAKRNRPVRIRFHNNLPTGAGGDLFIPVDKTIMGAGLGPPTASNPTGSEYTQNRAAVHLHGGFSPWISDGTPHQWITPAGETTDYPEGVSLRHVPDMPDFGPGYTTLFYTNQQSARLMFYHDHAVGITRLNVYAGEAAGYAVTDDVEEDLIAGTNKTGVNPALKKLLPDQSVLTAPAPALPEYRYGIPLILQDKAFVDPKTIASQDPTWLDPAWRAGTGNVVTGLDGRQYREPVEGDMWYPHVYVPAQNPGDPSGANAFGRWHYGPWFWPPTADVMNQPVANPYYDNGATPWEPPLNPNVPDPSMPGEAFVDTPIINGGAYPYMEVPAAPLRFRILNAANDRFFNLQWYVANADTTDPLYFQQGGFGTEVKMVPASVSTPGLPPKWPIDGRDGGAPDPASRGPAWIQLGTEGGFLPEPVVVPNQPILWNGVPTTFNFGNVTDHSLLLGCAERADVIVDFTNFAGKTLILYNDAPAAFPALDFRNDYYTGNPDSTDTGGAPPTLPGYGPNIRTIMQVRVLGTGGTAPVDDYNPTLFADLKAAWAKTTGKRGVFEVSLDEIIVPEARYNSAYAASFPADPYVRQQHTSKTFTTIDGDVVTIPIEPKGMHDEMGGVYDIDYGRMSGMLGLEIPGASGTTLGFTMYNYASPPIELLSASPVAGSAPKPGDGTQIWKITHNGVDTHPIHWHLWNLQLINRVAWDGAIIPPDATELGWKETIRVNPLEHTIVAARPVLPYVPFDLPNSIRLIDPNKQEGALLTRQPGAMQDGQIQDPLGNPVIVTNSRINFGHEYVWHCHILAHEEMDMMHALVLGMPPRAPSNLRRTNTSGPVNLAWNDNSANETGFTIWRATDPTFTTGLVKFTVGANATAYSDGSAPSGTLFYRVQANNLIGDPTVYAAPAIGFPSRSLDSAFSNVLQIGATAPSLPAAPTNLTGSLVAGPRVDLTFRDNANNETGFVIERQTTAPAAVAYAQIAVLPPRTGTGNVTYSDTTVVGGNSYQYRVKAVNSLGSSAWATTGTVDVPLPPKAPSGLFATAVRVNNRASVTLTWIDNSNNETGFTIQRASDSQFTLNLNTSNVGAGVSTTTQTGLNRLTVYWYRVRAFNLGGASAWSNSYRIQTP